MGPKNPLRSPVETSSATLGWSALAPNGVIGVVSSANAGSGIENSIFILPTLTGGFSSI